MPRTIYLVSSGDYSDYRVHMAFETEELANAYCERETPFHRYDEPFVEERELLDSLPEEPARVYRASARLTVKGEVTESSEESYNRSEWTLDRSNIVAQVNHVSGSMPSHDFGWIYIYVLASTADAAKRMRDALVVKYMADPTLPDWQWPQDS